MGLEVRKEVRTKDADLELMNTWRILNKYICGIN